QWRKPRGGATPRASFKVPAWTVSVIMGPPHRSRVHSSGGQQRNPHENEADASRCQHEKRHQVEGSLASGLWLGVLVSPVLPDTVEDERAEPTAPDAHDDGQQRRKLFPEPRHALRRLGGMDARLVRKTPQQEDPEEGPYNGREPVQSAPPAAARSERRDALAGTGRPVRDVTDGASRAAPTPPTSQ